MNEEIRAMIGEALHDEPSLRIDRGAVLVAGRRRLRRRRTAVVVVAALAVAAMASASAVAGGLLAGGGAGGRPADGPVPGSDTGCLREDLPSQVRPGEAELAESARLTAAFATVDFPDGVTVEPASPRLCAGGGVWNTQFTVTSGGTVRQLTVTVSRRADRPRQGCVDVPAGQCRQQTLPDGTAVEIADIVQKEPDDFDRVTVMAWRQDGTTVIVDDNTTTPGRGGRRVLSDDALIALATAGQLRLEWDGQPGHSDDVQRRAAELTAVLAAADVLPAGMRAASDGSASERSEGLEFVPRGGAYLLTAVLVDAAGSGSLTIEVYDDPSGDPATCADLADCTEVTLPDGTTAMAVTNHGGGVETITLITERPSGSYVVALSSNGSQDDTTGPTRAQVPLDVAALGRIITLF